MTGTQAFDGADATAVDEPESAALSAIHERLRAAWHREGGLPVARRVAILQALRASLLRDGETYCTAISADFGVRSRHETLLTEIVMLLQAIDYYRAPDQAVEHRYAGRSGGSRSGRRAAASVSSQGASSGSSVRATIPCSSS